MADNGKKRNRLSLSCNYCKKRKVKCDRKKPCGACLRYNVAYECEFPGHIWSSSDKAGSVAVESSIDIATNDKHQQPNGIPETRVFEVSNDSDLRHKKRKSSKIKEDDDTYGSKLFSASHAQTWEADKHAIPPIQSPDNTHNDSPYFTSPHHNELSHSNSDTNKKYAHPTQPIALPQTTLPSIVYTELEALKTKIKQLEATISVPVSSHKSSNSTISQYSTASPRYFNYSNFANTPNTPNNDLPLPIISNAHVQLPPIPSITRSLSANLQSKSVPFSLSNTYVGINIHDENDPDETMNLYSGYTPIYVQEFSGQKNYGPYSWISIMKKDEGLSALFSYMKSKRDKKFASLPLIAKEGKKLDQIPETKHEKEFTARALDIDGYHDVQLYTKERGRKLANDIDNLTHSNVEQAQKTLTSKVFNKNKYIPSPSQTDLNQKASHQEAKTELNKNAILLGLTVFEGKVDQELQLIEQIKVVLPKQKVIWTLVNKFFTAIYPFIPLVDESSFKIELVKILGPEDYRDEATPFFRIERRLDFANVGILLIMLRITYLSHFSNKIQVNESFLKSSDTESSETKYLMTNPVSIDVIKFSQLCLDQFDLTRRVSLSMMQLALMKRIYTMFSPENGDGADGGDSQTYNAILTQMAYSIGSNREPDLFEDVCNDEKTNNIHRKIWYYLRINDVSQASQFGNPHSIDENYYDIKVPFSKPGNENIADLKLDNTVNQGIQMSEPIYKELKGLITLTISIHQSPKLLKLSAAISKFELLVDANLGKLSDYTKTPVVPGEYPFVKIKKCKTYLNVKLFTVSLFFHMFLHYEKVNKLQYAFFYLKKIFSIIYGELYPEYIELLQNNQKNFDPHSTTSDLFLNPSLQNMIHKGSQLSFAILIRFNSAIQNLKSNDLHHNSNLAKNSAYRLRFAKLCKISKMLEKFIKFGVSCISRLSSRYYYAWRISKAHAFLADVLISEDFYKLLSKNEANLQFLKLTDSNLNELIEIAELSLMKTKLGVEMEFKGNGDQDLSKLPGASTQLEGEYPRDKLQSGSPFPNLEMFNTKNPTLETPHTDTNLDFFQTQSKPTFSNMDSVESTSSFSLDDFNIQNDVEVDRLWLQMVSMQKQEEMSGEQNNESQYHENNNDNFLDFYGDNNIMIDQMFNQPQQPLTPGIDKLGGANDELLNDDQKNGSDMLTRFSIDQLY